MRRDPAKGAQPAHGIRPRLAARHLLEPGVEGGELRVECVEVGDEMGERLLGEGVGEALAAHPGEVSLRPGLLALREDVAVAQQGLGNAVASGGARLAQIVAGTNEVAQALLLERGRGDEGERTGAGRG